MKLNLPVIVLNRTVLLPSQELKLEFEDQISKGIVDESEFFHNNKVLVVTQNTFDSKVQLNALPYLGTICEISKKLELPNGKTRIILKGIIRAHVINYLSPNNITIESIVETVNPINIDDSTKEVIIKKLFNEIENYTETVPYVSNSLLALIQDLKDLDVITDIIVNHLSLEYERLYEYLSESNSIKRSEMILQDIYKEEQLYNIEENIDKKVKKEIDKGEKDFYLKEKIKMLQGELGELNKKDEEVEELKNKVQKLNTSDEIKNNLINQITRYEEISPSSPEINQVKNYIDYMLNLPWGVETEDIDDLDLVKSNLDSTHYGLDEIKTRIIEYLAVKKQSNNIESPIICLVGPPGVGKTSLSYSIAKSMGRKFAKISVGGVDDYSYIKGHTRAYVGATPGKIIDGIKRAKSSNPVFLIDEVDKMQSGYKGDPASALLEVLDITQNKNFKDNYIDEEFDLSKVLFILTANDVSSIPPTLKDRLEIITISGYTNLEKLAITKQYIIPKVCQSHGINNFKISDEDILDIIRYYTKESGIRELYRIISKIARRVVTNKYLNNKRLVLSIKDIEKYLGKKIYTRDNIEDEIGLVNGLAYTTNGGDIVPIETNYYKGKGELIITGSIGDVMHDSAKIALSYIKANYKYFNIDYNLFDNDIHINIPNIAIKKDGPSAGVTLTTSLISSLTGLKIKQNIAMTGEITLRGNVLKVGGIKEKIIGAYLNNIDVVFIPYSNLVDLDSIPVEIKNKIKFIPVKKYTEIYEYLKMN